MNCPDPLLWNDVVNGQLPREEQAALQAHASGCVECAAKLHAARTRARSEEQPTTELDGDKLHIVLPKRAPADELAAGTQVARYSILHRVAEGGMGVVYAAYDPDLDRRVAIKLLHAQLGGDAGEAQQRMLREAQAMARLSHPNVVAVYDVGTFGDRVFLALEFVDGVTLKQWLRDGKRTVAEIVSVFRDAGRGLDAAHRADLVHRDFKPDNVLIGRDGQVRVTDFGVARIAHAAEERPRTPRPGPVDNSALSSPLTQADHVIGTIGYMAPEQYQGGTVSAQSDQFAFSISLYEALYGKKPFEAADTHELVKAVLEGRMAEPPKDARVPGWLHRILVRGLSRNPGDRFESMAAVVDALGRDPRLVLRKWGTIAVVTSAVVALAVAAVQSNRTQSQLCSGAERRLAGIWDAHAKEAVRAAFLASGRSYAGGVFDAASSALDSYARTWTGMHRETCEATRVRGEQTEEILSLRMICLDSRLNELSALSRAFAQADGTTVDKAIQASFQLASIKDCADITTLKAAAPLPTDERSRSRIIELRRQLADVRVLTSAGQFAKAMPVATEAMKTAQEIGFRPAIAEALAARAEVLTHAGEFAKALEALTTAAYEAHAIRRDDLVAHLSLRAAHIAGLAMGRAEEAQHWIRLAEATIDRIGTNEVLRLEALSVAGYIDLARGRVDEAIAHHERALELGDRALEANHPFRWKRFADLGTSYLSKRDHHKAREMFEKARELREPLGADHPDMGLVHSSLGTIYFALGDEEKSRAGFEKALAIRERTFGTDNARLFPTLNNLADALNRAGRSAEALVHVERALALKGVAKGSMHALVGTITLAEVNTRLGRAAQAREALDPLLTELQKPNAPAQVLFAALQARTAVALREGKLNDALLFGERAIEVGEKTLGKDSAELAQVLHLIGEAQLQARRAERAVVTLERALKLGEGGGWPPAVADTQVLMAQALISAKADVGRARQLLLKARETYAAVRFRRASVADVDALLASVPVVAAP